MARPLEETLGHKRHAIFTDSKLAMDLQTTNQNVVSPINDSKFWWNNKDVSFYS